MTREEIINLLKISGSNTEKQVVDMLENATIEQLQELRESINEKIRIMTSKYQQLKKRGQLCN